MVPTARPIPSSPHWRAVYLDWRCRSFRNGELTMNAGWKYQALGLENVGDKKRFERLETSNTNERLETKTMRFMFGFWGWLMWNRLNTRLGLHRTSVFGIEWSNQLVLLHRCWHTISYIMYINILVSLAIYIYIIYTYTYTYTMYIYIYTYTRVYIYISINIMVCLKICYPEIRGILWFILTVPINMGFFWEAPILGWGNHQKWD